MKEYFLEFKLRKTLLIFQVFQWKWIAATTRFFNVSNFKYFSGFVGSKMFQESGVEFQHLKHSTLEWGAGTDSLNKYWLVDKILATALNKIYTLSIHKFFTTTWVST